VGGGPVEGVGGEDRRGLGPAWHLLWPDGLLVILPAHPEGAATVPPAIDGLEQAGGPGAIAEVLKIDESRRNIVVSRRKLIESEREEAHRWTHARTWPRLRCEGQHVRGEGPSDGGHDP